MIEKGLDKYRNTPRFFGYPATLKSSSEDWRSNGWNHRPFTNENGTKVLLIDDDPHHLALFNTLLTTNNFSVTTSLLPDEGLKKAQHSSIGVVICDLKMPKMDGYKFLTALRSIPNCASLPVIILTGSKDKDSLESSLISMGADMYCRKTQTENLIEQLNLLLNW